MNTIRKNTKLGVALGILSALVLAGLCTAATPPENSGHGAGTAPSQVSDKSHGVKVPADFGKLPMAFEQNKGQTDARVSFLARGAGYSAFLTPSEVVLRLKADKENRAVVRMKFLGSSPATHVEGADTLPGKTNYFIGNDSSKWVTNVAQYASVRYADIYPGIDAVLHGDGGQLRYDFIVKPGADPKTIGLAFEGADKVAIDENGALTLQVAGKPLVHRRPHIYQEGPGGVRQDVAGAFKMSRDGQVAFHIAQYDTRRPLVIDPIVQFSTYLGGSAIDTANGVALNTTGIYVVGTTDSTNFPLGTNTPPAGYQSHNAGLNDVFVAELDLAGTTLLADTYLGGTSNDYGNAIALDSNGNVTVVGQTFSTNFPVTTGGALPGLDAAFVARLNPALNTLIFSEYIGGATNTIATAVTVDSTANTYVAGYTDCVNFPVTVGPANHGSSDAFVGILSSAGAITGLATYGGPSAETASGIALSAGGTIYIAGTTSSTSGISSVSGSLPPQYWPGQNGNTTALGGAPNASDAFVMEITNPSLALNYGTYLGGTSPASVPGGHCTPTPATSSCTLALGMAVDGNGRAYITGQTNSVAGTGTFLPTSGAFQIALATTVKGGYDAFIAIIDPSQTDLVPGQLGAQLRYLTYYGAANATDIGTAIAIDSPIPADQNSLDLRQIYITGTTVPTSAPDLLPMTSPKAPNTTCDPYINGPQNGGLGTEAFNGTGPAVNITASFVARFNPNANFPSPCKVAVNAPENFPSQLDFAQFYNGTGTGALDAATAIALSPDRTLVIAGQTNSPTGISTAPPTFQVDQGSKGVPDGFVAALSFNDIVTTAPELPQLPWAPAGSCPTSAPCTLQTIAGPTVTPLLFDYSNSDIDNGMDNTFSLVSFPNGLPEAMVYGNSENAYFTPLGPALGCLGPPFLWTPACDAQNVNFSNTTTFVVSYTDSTLTTFGLPTDASVANVIYSSSNGLVIAAKQEWLCVVATGNPGCATTPGITQDITPGVGRVTLDMANVSKLPEGVYYATFAVCASLVGGTTCSPVVADNYSTLATVTLWKHPTLLPFCTDETVGSVGKTCSPAPVGPNSTPPPNGPVGSVVNAVAGALPEPPVMTFVWDENATACVPPTTGCASSILLYAIDYIPAEPLTPGQPDSWPPLPAGLVGPPYGSTPGDLGGTETVTITANECSGPDGITTCSWLTAALIPNNGSATVGGAVDCGPQIGLTTLVCPNAVPLDKVADPLNTVNMTLQFSANAALITPTVPCPGYPTSQCPPTGNYTAIVTVSAARAKDVEPSSLTLVPPESSFTSGVCPIPEAPFWPFAVGLAFPGEAGPVCVPAGPNSTPTNPAQPVGTYLITFVVENNAQVITIVPPQLPIVPVGPGQSITLTAEVSNPVNSPGFTNPNTIEWSLAPFNPATNPPCGGAVTTSPTLGTLSGSGPSSTETYTAPAVFSLSSVTVYGCRPAPLADPPFGPLTLASIIIPLTASNGLGPAAPALVSPASGATGQFGLPTLTWVAAAGASTYNVYIGTSSPPTQVATGITGTSYTLTSNLSPGTTYYWMVEAVNGSGTADSVIWSFTTESAPPKTTLGDFNGDGYPDVVWVNSTTGQASVWFLQGTTFLGFNLLPSIPTGWNLVAAADFNQDGIPDLVLQNATTRVVTVWYIGPTQNFLGWDYLNAAGSPGWTVVGAADFNGDGVPDLIYQNDSTQQVVVDYYDQKPVTGAPPFLGWAWLNAAGNPGWTVVGAADFDLNGTPDLIWENLTTRQTTVNYYSAPANYLAAPTLTTFSYLDSQPGWTARGANDYNHGNGLYPDLVWENDTTQQVTVNFFDDFTFLGFSYISQAGEPAGWQVIVPE